MKLYANITNPEPHIILVKAEKPEPTTEDFEDYMTRMLEVYKTHHDIVVIYDLTKAKFLKMELRIKQGKWVRTHQNLINSKVYGVAFVTSPVSKIMMKAIFLVQTPVWKHKIFSNLDNAYKWAYELIEAHKNM